MTTREELQRIMNAPGFGTGRAYRDRKAQEADALAILPEPEDMAPVLASTDCGANWLICSFGKGGEDGQDWHLVTDAVRASQLADVGFPADAKTDAFRVAAIINAYRMGLLVRRDT